MILYVIMCFFLYVRVLCVCVCVSWQRDGGSLVRGEKRPLLGVKPNKCAASQSNLTLLTNINSPRSKGAKQMQNFQLTGIYVAYAAGPLRVPEVSFFGVWGLVCIEKWYRNFV